MYVDQIKAGQDYAKFKKCVSISILNFNLFPDNLKNKQNISDQEKILDDEFYSCFHIREDNHHFLYTDKMEFQMLASKNTYIDSAYERLQIISQDKQKQMEYEARQKAILDHNQMVLEATEKGMKQGIEQGFERSIEHVAKNLINEGYSTDEIVKLTGISVDIIEKIQKNS